MTVRHDLREERAALSDTESMLMGRGVCCKRICAPLLQRAVYLVSCACCDPGSNLFRATLE